MKKYLPVFILLAITIFSQPPFITQTGQLTVGPTSAADIKFWGDDFIVSRDSFQTDPSRYTFQLIFISKFGEVYWTREFAPRTYVATKNIIISPSNLFCIFTLGDTIYKINRDGELIKSVALENPNYVRLALQPNGEITVMEASYKSSFSKFYVYNEELELIRVISNQPGSTHSVLQFNDSYFISGSKKLGGILSDASSYVAKYDTLGNLLWVTRFPDHTQMYSVISSNRLYYCCVEPFRNKGLITYGELDKDFGNVIWTRSWHTPYYPDTLMNTLGIRDIIAAPTGGFLVLGQVTAPGQDTNHYEPNMPAGLVLGYSPDWNYTWYKTSFDFGSFTSGDLKNNSLVAFGNLGMFPTVAKIIIYSVSGLTGIEDDAPGSKNFTLRQNHPNPFNPSTKIEFFVPEAGLISLKVYDLLGSEVAVLVNEELLSGKYEVSFDASNIASGIYLYVLRWGGHIRSRKMILLR